MTVKAIYMGQQKNGEYWVNVRNAQPKGLIGDAGYIRHFNSKDEAKAYTKEVNETGVDSFVKQEPKQEPLNIRHEGDTFVSSQKAN